jgi:hypothetical protein
VPVQLERERESPHAGADDQDFHRGDDNEVCAGATTLTPGR